MLIIKFDNSDLSEHEKRVYDTLEMKWEGKAEANLDDYMQMFRSFLIARTFSAEAVDEFFGLNEEE